MTNLLPADLAQFVQQELSQGHYQSVEEMVCESLRLLRTRQQKLDELRKELQPSLDELDRGGGIIVKQEELRAFLEGIAAEVKAELEVSERSGA